MYFYYYSKNDMDNPKTNKVFIRYIYNVIKKEIENSGLGSNTGLGLLARNPNCPIDILEDMLTIEEPRLSYVVVNNTNYSQDKVKLAQMLMEPDCPVETLISYSENNSVDLRCYVAQNPNCPIEILKKLSEDEFDDVKIAVAQNPNCPIDILTKMVKTTENEILIVQVLNNPNCPKDLYYYIYNYYFAEDNNYINFLLKKTILRNIVYCDNCPEDLLIIIIKSYTIPNCNMFDNKFLHDLLVKYNNGNHSNIFKLLLEHSSDLQETLKTLISLDICNGDILEMCFNKSLYYGVSSFISQILNHPNCTRKIWETFYNSEREDKFQIMARMAKNPNCPTYILELLSNSPQIRVLEAVLRNPNCPIDILKKLSNDEMISVRVLVAKHSSSTKDILTNLINHEDLDQDILINVICNPNCDDEIMQKLLLIEEGIYNAWRIEIEEVRYYIARYSKSQKTLTMLYNICRSKDYFEDILNVIIENEYCPSFIKLSHGILEDKYKNKLVPKLFCFQLIDKLYEEYALFGKSEKFEKLYKIVEHTLIQDNVDRNLLLYFGNRMSYRWIRNHISKELANKIDPLVEDNKTNLNIFERTEDCHLLSVYNRLIGFLNGIKTEEDKNVLDVPSKYLQVCELREGLNAYIKIGEPFYSLLGFTDKIETVRFGECPQEKVSDFENWILNKLNDLKLLKKTGKVFKNNSNGTKYYVYEIEGLKYIKMGSSWIRVKPLEWVTDPKRKNIDLKYKHNNKYREMFCEWDIKNLLVYDSDDSEQNKEIDSRIKKFKEISTIEEEKQREEKRKKQIEEEISKKEQIEKSKEEEISKIEEEIFGLLKTIRQKVDTLSELRGSKKSIMFTQKVLIDMEYLIVKFDDHIEFNKEYIPYLRFIDLSYIDSKNLKVSGIDFRGTNIRIDPQKVYNKDLSYSKFDDQNFAFKDFSGCDLRGTDLSNEVDCVGYENAITDDNTILPNDVIGKKTL